MQLVANVVALTLDIVCLCTTGGVSSLVSVCSDTYYWDSKQETFFQLLRRLHESSKENDFFPEVKVPRAFQGILFQEPLIKYLKNEDIYYRSRL